MLHWVLRINWCLNWPDHLNLLPWKSWATSIWHGLVVPCQSKSFGIFQQAWGMMLTMITGVVPRSICGTFNFKMPHKTLVGKSGPATKMHTFPRAKPRIKWCIAVSCGLRWIPWSKKTEFNGGGSWAFSMPLASFLQDVRRIPQVLASLVEDHFHCSGRNFVHAHKPLDMYWLSCQIADVILPQNNAMCKSSQAVVTVTLAGQMMCRHQLGVEW